ncbi:hypothetical protein [Rathayibacter oskolensis]|uniref:hypothetical protein n=1 Tax=Rathayibacter oskolensis TaxID=1891671 RepID=UPI003467BE25
MRTKLMFMTAGLAAAALTLTGCAGDSGSGESGSGEAGGTSTFEVATDVTLEGSPTFDAMTDAGE